jgi:hypothetical protein
VAYRLVQHAIEARLRAILRRKRVARHAKDRGIDSDVPEISANLDAAGAEKMEIQEDQIDRIPLTCRVGHRGPDFSRILTRRRDAAERVE